MDVKYLFLQYLKENWHEKLICFLMHHIQNMFRAVLPVMSQQWSHKINTKKVLYMLLYVL